MANEKKVSISWPIKFTEQEVMLIRMFMNFIDYEKKERLNAKEKELIALNIWKDLWKLFENSIDSATNQSMVKFKTWELSFGTEQKSLIMEYAFDVPVWLLDAKISLLEKLK